MIWADGRAGQLHRTTGKSQAWSTKKPGGCATMNLRRTSPSSASAGFYTLTLGPPDEMPLRLLPTLGRWAKA
jgi:hypothetical protein